MSGLSRAILVSALSFALAPMMAAQRGFEVRARPVRAPEPCADPDNRWAPARRGKRTTAAALKRAAKKRRQARARSSKRRRVRS